MKIRYILLAIVVFSSLCIIPMAHARSLTEMMDKLDKIDAADFADLITKANKCADQYNFLCAEDNIKKARRMADTKTARTELTKTEKHLESCRKAHREEQERIAEEKRRKAELARKDAERIKREEEREWQRQEEQWQREREEKEEQQREAEERRQDERLARQREDNAAMTSAYNESMQKLNKMNRDIASMGSNWKNPYEQSNQNNRERAQQEAAERRRQAENARLERERQRQEMEARRAREEAAKGRQQVEYARREMQEQDNRTVSTYKAKESSGQSQKAVLGKIAILVTWKNKSDYWFAAGPTQSTQVGEKEEQKAIQYVKGKGSLSYVGELGRYKIYKLNRTLESYEEDVRSRLKREGYDPFTIDQSL